MIDEPFGGFCEAETFYIYARTVNGREIDCGELYCDSAEDAAKALLDGGEGIPPYVERVIFSGEFSIPDTQLERPFSFVFSGNVTVDGSLRVSAGGGNSLTVDTSGNSVPLTGNLRFDMPDGSLFGRAATRRSFRSSSSI